MGKTTFEDSVLVDRRKTSHCRLPKSTQHFLKFWPLLLAITYATVGFWPSTVFNNDIDMLYSSLALVISFLGVLSTIFWKTILLRNILASVALARSASIITLAIIAEPPIPFPAIMRLTGAGILACIFFCLVMVEIPYLKALRDGY